VTHRLALAVFRVARIDAVFSCSPCEKLQSDVGHCPRVADDVASPGEEQVDVFVQPPCAAEVERHVGTSVAFFWWIAEQLCSRRRLLNAVASFWVLSASATRR
jgi:hypothetical protein